MSITAGITVDYATHVGHSFLVQVFISKKGSYPTMNHILPWIIFGFNDLSTQEGISRPARVTASLARFLNCKT